MTEENRIIATLVENADRTDRAIVKLTKRVDRTTRNIDALGKRVDVLGERMDQSCLRMDVMGEKVDRLEGSMEKVITTLVHMDEKISTLATKDEVREIEGRMMTVLDHHTTMLTKLDQERFTMIARMDRIEGVV